MNIYKSETPSALLKGNPYPGRGIIVGQSKDGEYAVSAYFIMGRSANSRNRIFRAEGDDVTIYPYDADRVEDPSLIIYSPVRRVGEHLIVTNGDQTDTIRDGLKEGKTFSASLESRCFEPDAPNFTPRISAMLTFSDATFTYQMSILKSGDREGTVCNRYTYAYAPLPGVGHFIHTYMTDGTPLPTFCGEPERVALTGDIDALTEEIWSSLNEENRISLFVRYTRLSDGQSETRIINRFE